MQLSKENCFIFHVLPHKLLISTGLKAYFGWPLFKFWLKPGKKLLTKVRNLHCFQAVGVLLDLPQVHLMSFKVGYLCERNDLQRLRLRINRERLTCRVQRKLILQLARQASCNQHLLARKSFLLVRKKFFKSRMKK